MSIAQTKKFFIIFAYPGVSGFLHVGHLRSYTYPDVIAKYKRLMGHEVFFPAGLHASGLPAVGFALRVRRKDPIIIRHLKEHGVDDDTIRRLEDPVYAIRFFAEKYLETWRNMGIEIDADAFCTTIDEGYKRFIRWQMRTLEKKGFLVQKPHYSPYCPNCGPVAVDPSETDLSKGGDAKIINVRMIKAPVGDLIVPISIIEEKKLKKVVVSEGSYYLVRVDNEKWLVNSESITKFVWQKNAEVLDEIVDVGSIVGSKISVCGLDVPVEYQRGKPWFGSGILGDTTDNNFQYDDTDVILDFDKEVVCRCSKRVYVKPISNQWFIRYSDETVKRLAKEHIGKMMIKPETFKKNLISHIIDWYGDRACARKGKWLGTEWRGWIIEPISDSVIYPAYYIVARFINRGLIKPEQLTDDVFDYVFLGHGNPEDISHKTGIPIAILNEMRRDFEFWYPVDLNCGGKEHQTVHFPVYIMAHIMIFPEKFWPRGIFVNWWVMGEKGSKISKSKGGAEPVPGLIRRYGADLIRLFYVMEAEPYSDIIWSEKKLERYRRILEKIKRTIELLIMDSGENHMDMWLMSRLRKTMEEYIRYMDKYELRKALMRLLDFIEDVDWYFKRGGRGNIDAAKSLIEMFYPFIPFTANTLASKIAYRITRICLRGTRNNSVEREEKYLMMLIHRYRKLRKIFERRGLVPKRIRVKVATNEEKRMIQENISFLEKEFGAGVVLDDTIEKEPKPWKPIILLQFD